MSKQNAISITIRGTAIDARAFGNLKSAIGKVDEKMTLAANAATVQAVVHGNWVWIRDLFNVDGMRKQNGDLTKRGAELRDYIKTFAPINFETKDGNLTIKGTKNRKNKGMFFALEKDEDGAPLKVDAAENPDFPQTLTEWRNAQGATEDDGPKNKKAVTLANQLAAMAAIVAGEKEDVNLIGSAEELAALSQAAVKLAELAAIESSRRAAESEEVDQEAAAMLASTVSSAETRAPQAVAH